MTTSIPIVVLVAIALVPLLASAEEPVANADCRAVETLATAPALLLRTLVPPDFDVVDGGLVIVGAYRCGADDASVGRGPERFPASGRLAAVPLVHLRHELAEGARLPDERVRADLHVPPAARALGEGETGPGLLDVEDVIHAPRSTWERFRAAAPGRPAPA